MQQTAQSIFDNHKDSFVDIFDKKIKKKNIPTQKWGDSY